MSSNIVPPASFDASKLTFGDLKTLESRAKIVNLEYDGSRRGLMTQTASMALPYGMNTFDKAGPASYSVDLSFRGIEENPKLQAFHDMLGAFDDAIKAAAVKNSLKWFGKTYTAAFIDEFYTPSIKVSIDRATGKPKPYPPTLKVKLPKEDGAFKTQFYDANKQRMDGSPEEFLVKGARGTFLIKCTGLWFAGQKFGASWKAEQGLLQYVPETAASRGCAIVDDDDDVPAPTTASRSSNRFAAVADDEDEDVVDAVMPAQTNEEEEEDDVVEAPVLPTKKAAPAPAPAPAPAAGVKKVIKRSTKA